MRSKLGMRRIAKLPAPLREAQQRAILNVLSKRMAAYIREVLMDRKKSYESPWARELRLDLEAAGAARGRAEGEMRGKAEALLVFLSTRGISVSAAQRRDIQECMNVELVDRWIRRAATASSVAEVLEAEASVARKPAAKRGRAGAPRRASRA